MGKMGQQPRMMIALGSDELAAMNAKVDMLMAKIDRVRMAPLDEWIRVQEYAKIVGRGERTVRNWVKAGSIESKRVGGVLMVRR